MSAPGSKPRMKWTYPWRFQLWGPIPGYHNDTHAVWHSPWRARLRFCKCMGCTIDKLDRERPGWEFLSPRMRADHERFKRGPDE